MELHLTIDIYQNNQNAKSWRTKEEQGMWTKLENSNEKKETEWIQNDHDNLPIVKAGPHLKGDIRTLQVLMGRKPPPY